jgi:hypothetical protein
LRDLAEGVERDGLLAVDLERGELLEGREVFVLWRGFDHAVGKLSFGVWKAGKDRARSEIGNRGCGILQMGLQRGVAVV